MKYRKKKEFVEVFHVDRLDYEILHDLAKFCGKVKYQIDLLDISDCKLEVYDSLGYIGSVVVGLYLVKQNNKIEILTKSAFESKYELD